MNKKYLLLVAIVAMVAPWLGHAETTPDEVFGHPLAKALYKISKTELIKPHIYDGQIKATGVTPWPWHKPCTVNGHLMAGVTPGNDWRPEASADLIFSLSVGQCLKRFDDGRCGYTEETAPLLTVFTYYNNDTSFISEDPKNTSSVLINYKVSPKQIDFEEKFTQPSGPSALEVKAGKDPESFATVNFHSLVKIRLKDQALKSVTIEDLLTGRTETCTNLKNQLQ